MTPEVLFCDNHLLIVCKPAGLPVQKDRTGDPDLLTAAKNFVKQHFDKPGDVYLGLVHRLDRPVSGVMAFARTSKAAGRLSAQFREGRPEKKYMAIVQGNVRGQGVCTDYLVKENEKVRIVGAAHPKALFAELSWQAMAGSGELSLLDIELKTGRPHQIRVQLASGGWPLLGDMRYGSRREFDGRNLALHCYRLGLEHPVLKTPMSWTAPPPETWQGFFDTEIEALLKPGTI
jgi:23S rRNA pseudouridine1911/1915/1917 synthase